MLPELTDKEGESQVLAFLCHRTEWECVLGSECPCISAKENSSPIKLGIDSFSRTGNCLERGWARISHRQQSH